MRIVIETDGEGVTIRREGAPSPATVPSAAPGAAPLPPPVAPAGASPAGAPAEGAGEAAALPAGKAIGPGVQGGIQLPSAAPPDELLIRAQAMGAQGAGPAPSAPPAGGAPPAFITDPPRPAVAPGVQETPVPALGDMWAGAAPGVALEQEYTSVAESTEGDDAFPEEHP